MPCSFIKLVDVVENWFKFLVSYRVITHQRVVGGSRGARRARQSLQRRKLGLEIIPNKTRNRGKETGTGTGSEGLPVLLVLPSRRARHVCRFYPVNQNHINHTSNLILMHPPICHTSNWLSNQSISQSTNRNAGLSWNSVNPRFTFGALWINTQK